jgi:signal transduction histidine kinase
MMSGALPVPPDDQFDANRSELIRRRVRVLTLVICGLWIPMGLFTDPMMFGNPLTGLWVRLPTAGLLLLLRYWLRRPRARRKLEAATAVVLCLVLGAFGPVVAVCRPDNNLPNLLSIVIGAMAVTSGAALSWPATATICTFANLAMLFGGLARVDRPEPLYFWLDALGFVLLPFMIFAAGSRERWQRAEWQARENLREANERLRREEVTRNQLFANLSHDLRTPLSVVRSEIELLQEQADVSSARAFERIVDNVNSVVDLLDQLLDLARLEAKAGPCVRERCEIVSAAREVAARMQPGRADVRILVRPGSDTIHAAVDASHLRRILVNLVSNALRQLLPHGGDVEIAIAQAGGDRIWIDVSDTGAGIAPQLRARLFERFATFNQQGGTASGIGLALARELAELNSGGLALLDGAPRTTFRLDLESSSQTTAGATHATSPAGAALASTVAPVPEVVRPQTVDLSASPTASPERDPGQPPVLIIEDNRDLREVMVRAVSRSFAVEAVESFSEALRWLLLHKPVAIVSDVMLPDGDGYQLLRVVRQRSRLARIPFLLVSALASPAERVRGLEAGADDYLPKPFSSDELRARIAAAIGRMDEREARVEREREDLLMELHDGVCSSLARASLMLAPESAPTALDRRAHSAFESVQEGLSEARGLLDALGAGRQSWRAVVGNLRWQLAETAGRAGVAVDLSLDDAEVADIPPLVAHAVRRIAAEALTNTIRHASAQRFMLTLETRERTIHLRAEDDGPGTSADLVEGRGLAIVRRRAGRCGGAVKIERQSRGSVIVEAWLPIDDPAPAPIGPD